MHNFDKHDASGQPAWLGPLTRAPIRVKESTTDKELERELLELLYANLQCRCLMATPAGYRELALRLLIEKGAPLEFVADLDLIRGGHPGAAESTSRLRDEAKKLRETGHARTNVDAAKILSKRKGEKRAEGTIAKLLSRPKSNAAKYAPLRSRWERRRLVHIRVLGALHIAADRLEKITN